MIKNTIIILFFICVFFSCVKKSPQLPSNKGNTNVDEITNLVLINQNLAQKEDSILQLRAQKDTSFKKNNLGFWYKIDQKSKGSSIKEKDKCRFSYRMMLLDGKVIERSEDKIVIGQKQIVVGLEEGIKLLHRGESATFIIPWYLGFGMNGNKTTVPPYKSIIYVIKIY